MRLARKPSLFILFIVFTLVSLTRCGNGGGGAKTSYDSTTGSVSKVGETLLIDSTFLKSASTTGDIADIALSISASSTAFENAYLRVEVFDDNNEKVAKSSSQRLAEGESHYDVTVAVPYVADPINATQTYSAVAYISYSETADVDLSMTQKRRAFSLGFPAGITPLSDVAAVQLQIIPGSYSSVNTGSRRVHYFSAQVFDQDNQSIGGLETNTEKYFKAFEDGILDEESSVTVDSRKNSISVYLILDVSSSIYQANATTELMNAASQTVLSLSSFSQFNYREFSGDVRTLDSLRHLNFETQDSATALYRAIDSAISDIQIANNTLDDTVIIAFTDGRDLASRNHYLNMTHLQVRNYVVNKIETVKQERKMKDYGSLTTHFVGLGSGIDEEALSILAGSGGGSYFFADDKENLANVFAALAELIKSTYRLEYSSQQLPDDTRLELQVDINGVIDTKTVKSP